jgi:hypothetical protein
MDASMRDAGAVAGLHRLIQADIPTEARRRATASGIFLDPRVRAGAPA